MAIAAPSARRRLIGGALRRYREGIAYTLEDSARCLGCDRSRISRIETGQRGISVQRPACPADGLRRRGPGTVRTGSNR